MGGSELQDSPVHGIFQELRETLDWQSKSFDDQIEAVKHITNHIGTRDYSNITDNGRKGRVP